MLEEITIRDLGVVRRAAVPLGPGFTAVTGETGAGKTMVVTALQLLAGGRADASRVREGADGARVEARVVLPAERTAAHRVADLGGDLEPVDPAHSEVILSRGIAATGRSRAWVGGAAVPVRALAELGDQLITVHGQSDQLRLRSAVAQREALDHFAGPAAAALLQRCRATWDELQAAQATVDELAAIDADRDQRIEEYTAELEHIEQIDPDPAEYAPLTQTLAGLEHQEEIVSALGEAHQLLNGDERGAGIRDLVETARAALDRVRQYGDDLASVADQFADLGFRVEDVATALGGLLDTQEPVGPEAIQQAADRLAALDALRRRYGDLAAARARAQTLRNALEEAGSSDQRLADARAAAAAAQQRLQDVCAELTRVRTDAADRLGAAIDTELASLAMPTSQFLVMVTPGTPGPTGGDEVEFLLRAHPGARPTPVAKSASGGELSRIMLALELNLAAENPELCFVFDEVDSGVGGSVALEIGRRLQRLGTRVQVIAVTHLPQVAAFADRQITVIKHTDTEVTASDVRLLTGEERVHEIARMLSGLAESDTALAHARELLDTAAKSVPKNRR